MRRGRRAFLLSSLSLAAAACVRPVPRPSPASPTPLVESERWTQEANGILSDASDALNTFDIFQAFRVSTARESSMRLGSELVWDPPTGAEWDRATKIARALYGRADQLFQAVTSAAIDPSQWRGRRALADAAHDLLDVSVALHAYRDRVQTLPPSGDAAGALGLLDTAWAQWETAAARWGVSRSELVGCGS